MSDSSSPSSSSPPSINPHAHPDFSEALALSSSLTAHIRTLDLSRLMYRAAVIDRQHLPSSSSTDNWLTDLGSLEINGGDTDSLKQGKGKGKARTAWAQMEIMGWSRFVQNLERQHVALEHQASRTHTADIRDSPLPPILSSLTLAKTLLAARTPVTGVRVTMGNKEKPVGQGGGVEGKMGGGNLGKGGGGGSGNGGGGGGEEVVDVICRGGAEWIKLWTKKESQMMAEFREQDSYATSDWSDSDSDPDSPSSSLPSTSSPKPSLSSPPLSNSLITTARSLLSLAHSTPRPPGTSPPRLTIRLTRIPLDPPGGHADARIPQTFDLLRSLGVKLVFGDLSDIPLSSLPPPQRAPSELLPSLKINLDPTALVGICTDALHHPVPVDMDQARGRYFRPNRYLHSKPGSTTASGTTTPVSSEQVESREDEKDEAWREGYDDHRQSQHSRELLKEALDEVRAPLIEELRDTLERAIAASAERGGGVRGVEFWTTEGALQHLKEAMSNTRVVGEGMEQQRMRRLIGLEEGDFWEGSRYEGQEGCLAGLRVRIFEDRPSTPPADHIPICPEGYRSLHESTADAARQFLAEYHAVVADSSLLSNIHSDIPPFLRPDRLPVPKVAELSVPLPIVSLGSIQRGAEEGMTTLCMGNVVWRELFAQARWRVRGWTQGNWEVERTRAEARATRNGDKPAEDVDGREEVGDGEEEVGEGEGNAVVWLMPYRSLGEGKRVRFERGDYSFPVPKS